MPPLECVCGYTTGDRSHFSRHQKSCRTIKRQAEWEENTERKIARVTSEFQAQLAEKDAQLEEKDARISRLEQIVTQLSQGVGENMARMQRENQEVRRRRDRYQERTATRVHLTEPQRRAIVSRQGWLCNRCKCDLSLAAYQIDHIESLARGGLDVDSNRQALCIPCHYEKTQQEQVERVQATRALPVVMAQPLE